jgi:hypothetical protein
MGPNSVGSADLTAIPNDLALQATLSDLRNSTGGDFNPHPGADLGLIVRLRVSDHSSCSGPRSGCPGPFDKPGTTFDLDLGWFPIQCVPNGDPNTPPGSDCNVSTTATAQFGTTPFPSGEETVLQVFRVRVNDDFPAGAAAFQQGIYIP